MSIFIMSYITCDYCEKTEEQIDMDEEQAERYIIKKGWVAENGFHFCPECKMIELDKLIREASKR